MAADSPELLRLTLLMGEALEACGRLYAYTADNAQAFFEDDGQRIAEVISGRKPIMDQLMAFDNELDQLLEALGAKQAAGNVLAGKVAKFRKQAREILDKVGEMDLQAMNLMSEKMHQLKDETLKLRNKKNLSAYISAGAAEKGGVRQEGQTSQGLFEDSV